MKIHTMHFKSVSANVWFTKRNTPFYATEEGTFPITAFSGMTTFIMQRELNDLNEEYTKLQWYKDINTH